MNRKFWNSVALLAVSVSMLGGIARADELKVGDKAPEFSLAGTDGKTYALADFKGKQAVVLAWFPKAFTGGCTKECKSIAASGAKLKPLGIAYFTASVDTAELNKKFADSLSLDYPILSDPDKKVATEYGVVHGERKVAERWTFYIDKEGVIKAIDKGVQKKTETAGDDIADKAKELGLTDKK